MTDLTNTAPKRIYLDIGDQFALERVASGDLRWDLLEGVTWSEDNATSHGIPYVRADLVPTPAASGAAPALPPLPGPHLIPGMYDTLGRTSLRYTADDMRNYALAALASREASPATLTDERIAELWIEHGLDEDEPEGFARIIEREVRAALASPQVAPASEPVAWLRRDGGTAWTDAQKRNATDTMGFGGRAVAGMFDRPLYLAAHTLVAPHPDDLAVDLFAVAMKEKLATARAKGRGGWERPDCTREALSAMLREHVEKGDPRDVANFCMFLHQRGEGIAAPTPVAPQDDARDAALWREHVAKLDALVTYCPTCCQGFYASKEMTRDEIIFECGKTVGRSTPAAKPTEEQA